ncbi:hypothetical protein [Burkholderia vietnamiensis]|uniref:hypothetical protein n=1 Tax=Burkholderia vietnamiensis TaxID=60552 RepID=UPI000B180AA9|nr:hypothetical protein [Burkholderia vietnamiensis]
MNDQRPEVEVDGECQQASKQRYTAVWIIFCLVSLQSGFAMINFLTWLLHSYGRWSMIFGSSSRAALWSTTIVWSTVSLISVSLMLMGRRVGRILYTCGATAWGLSIFVLAPWPLALSGTILPLLVLSMLYGRGTQQYLKDGVVLACERDTTRRGTIAAALWIFAAVYFYAVFFLQLTNKGWLADVTNGPQRLWVVLAMPAAPLIAVRATRKGARQWCLGLFLFVSGLSAFFVLLGYVPYSRALVGALGPGYVGYAVPWAGATMWVACLLLLGGTLILVFRPSKRNTRADRWAID